MDMDVFARVLDKGFDGVLGAALAGVLAGAFDVVLAGVFVGVFVRTLAGVLVGVLGPGLGVEFVVAIDIGFELGLVGVGAALDFVDGVVVGVFLMLGVDFVVAGFLGGGISAGGLAGILIGVMGRSLSSSSEYISSFTTSSWSPL